MAAKRKNDPVMPIPSTRDGKYSARNPLVVQPKKTAIPIPRPRMCSGKISASHTHTAMLRKVCIDSTNAATRRRITTAE